MNFFKLTPLYLSWHYTTAFVDMSRISGNMFWFLWYFFSVPDIFKNFFAPWERMGERYNKGSGIEDLASVFVVNTLMRIVGIIMRCVLLFFALISFIVTFVVVVAAYFIWVFLPIIIIAFFVKGINSFFK